MTYRFGPFRADRIGYRVFKDDQALDLTPKLLDLLFYFLERPATLVTKEALLDSVWPDANVTDNALAQAISDLRDALGDEPASPAYIRTVSRRGYRFVATVESPAADAPIAAPTPTTPVGALGAAERSAGQPTIAVLDFVNVTGDGEIAWLASGIAETVTMDLAALDRFRVIDRWRVVQAERGTDGSLHDVAALLGAGLVVTGSYQRSGPHVRITARLVDLARGDALADAKVDGPLDDVFSLQDAIVAAFARELQLPAPSAAKLGVRETSNLEAYRAYTEGWLKIESLDTDLIDGSIQDFEHAIALDPRYAIAYTGLANAEFVAHEMSRMTREPNMRALVSGIEHARLAVRLDERLAEAHATLSFVLASALKFDEARAAGQRAVSLEPESWRHHYRLGHATWGDSRLRALDRALGIYPQFAYALFEMAMVYVARGRFDDAEDIVRRGAAEQDRQGRSGDRFPVIGLRWLLGALRAARGDDEGAIAQFERELAQDDRRRLYGPEYAAVTLVSRGHAELARNRPERAAESFREALTHVEGFARTYLGLAAAWARLGDRKKSEAARAGAHDAIEHLRRTDRVHEALLLSACDAAVHEDVPGAVRYLDRLLEAGPPSHLGWTLPLEPALRPLQADPTFARILTRLADRAR
jgi:DNA-binding winged helix-turn-helix (wHTH) protein